jgi:hypothetical protein
LKAVSPFKHEALGRFLAALAARAGDVGARGMLFAVRLAGYRLGAAEVEVGVAGIADRPQAAAGAAALLNSGALAAKTGGSTGRLAEPAATAGVE